MRAGLQMGTRDMSIDSNFCSERKLSLSGRVVLAAFIFVCLGLLCLGLCCADTLNAADDWPKLASGPEIGSNVSSFYVRAVTGPHAGKSVCYVCRNGDRPVAMIFLRDVGADAARLLKQIDRFVNEHRAEGLRCFVVLLTEKSQADSARLQTLSFDEKLAIPLTVTTDASLNDSTRRIAPDAEVTVVLYNRLKVAARFGYRPGECDEAACESVLDATEKLVRESVR